MKAFGQIIVGIVILAVLTAILFPAFATPKNGGGPRRGKMPPYIKLANEGSDLYQQRRYHEAITKYEQSLKLRPGQHRLRKSLLSLYEQTHQPEKFRTHAQILVDDPETTNAFTAEKIVQIYELAKKSGIDHSTEMIDRALARLKPSRLTDPAVNLTITWNNTPQSKLSDLYVAAALQSLRATNYHMALQRTRQAIKIDSKNNDARIYAAFCAAKAHKPPAEIAGYLKPIQNPSPEVKAALQTIPKATASL